MNINATSVDVNGKVRFINMKVMIDTADKNEALRLHVEVI